MDDDPYRTTRLGKKPVRKIKRWKWRNLKVSQRGLLVLFLVGFSLMLLLSVVGRFISESAGWFILGGATAVILLFLILGIAQLYRQK